jgi:hypothetical protein
MPKSGRNDQITIRERAYFIWLREGCPDGRAQDHWRAASFESLNQEHDDEFAEEEKVLAGRPDANIPALLTKDVRGG